MDIFLYVWNVITIAAHPYARRMRLYLLSSLLIFPRAKWMSPENCAYGNSLCLTQERRAGGTRSQRSRGTVEGRLHWDLEKAKEMTGFYFILWESNLGRSKLYLCVTVRIMNACIYILIYTGKFFSQSFILFFAGSRDWFADKNWKGAPTLLPQKYED
jgi:hypothetical protein